jgi:hypothetical protein
MMQGSRTFVLVIDRDKPLLSGRRNNMPTEFLKLKVNDLGQVILPANDPEGRREFFKEFFHTQVGKRLASFGVNEETEHRISEIVAKRFGDREVTLDQLGAVVEQLILVHDPSIVPPEDPEPVAVADDRPRDAQGRFLSEFEIWASDANRSMREIRTRAEREPDFREWFHTATVAQTIQDGGLRVLGEPRRAPTDADRRLLAEFVRIYRITPSAQLKPLSGVVTLDQTHRYSVQEFQQLIERASSEGLL